MLELCLYWSLTDLQNIIFPDFFLTSLDIFPDFFNFYYQFENLSHFLKISKNIYQFLINKILINYQITGPRIIRPCRRHQKERVSKDPSGVKDTVNDSLTVPCDA